MRSWMPQSTDLHSLKILNNTTGRTMHHVLHGKGEGFARIVRTDRAEARYADHESWVYEQIEMRRWPTEPRFAPRPLAHITENGRVVGHLIERIWGRVPDANSCEDYRRCQEAVKRLHAIGLMHKDLHIGQFVIK